LSVAGVEEPATIVMTGKKPRLMRMRRMLARTLLAVLIVVPAGVSGSPPDTVVAHEVRDIVGKELSGTRRNAGEKRMFGTFVVAQVAQVYDTTQGQDGRKLLKLYDIGSSWPRPPVPFILRLTFDHGGAFRLERYGRASSIGLRDLELRYRDKNEVSLTKKFSRTVSKSSGYVYELEFLKEDMQPQYKMELWGFVNEREATRATGGVYKETIQIEVEAKK